MSRIAGILVGAFILHLLAASILDGRAAARIALAAIVGAAIGTSIGEAFL